MQIDINTVLITLISIISGASIILKAIAPLTKTNKDDKVLAFLLKTLAFLSLHVPEKKKELEIKIK